MSIRSIAVSGPHLQVRKTERDGDPALLLLRKPVGIGARQRLNQRGLAVIDVPDHAEYQARPASLCPPRHS